MAAGIQPIVVLNKTDLADAKLLQAVTATYAEAGFTVCHTAANPAYGEQHGIDKLRKLLHGRTSALYGLSGVWVSRMLARTHAFGRLSNSGWLSSTGVACDYPAYMVEQCDVARFKSNVQIDAERSERVSGVAG